MEALAQDLIDFQGTVFFTSHDRYFMQRIATCVIEVRDGYVRHYNGDYDAYQYAVENEIDDGQRAAKGQGRGGKKTAAKGGGANSEIDERKLRKKINNIERKIAKLDDEKNALNRQLLETTDAALAMELHNKITDVSQQLEEAENRWMELQEEIPS